MTLSGVLGKALRALAGLLVLLVGVAGFFTFAGAFAEYPVVPAKADAPEWVRGAFHVHTKRSDGRGSVEEVAKAAKAAGLQFVVLTDHNDFAAREPVYLDGVLMVPGVEISTRYGHLVAFGMATALEGPRAREVGVDAVLESGGVAVLAHPVQKRNPWKDPDGAHRAQGFELYSADTFFRDTMRRPFSRLVPAVGGYFATPVHGVMAMVTPQPASTERLLELARERPRLALCSHDAHGWPPYEDVFRSLAMYLPPDLVPGPLPGDARAAAGQVIQALASGRALCGFRALGEPAGFALEGLGPERREAQVGDVLKVSVPPHPPGVVEVRVWGPAKLGADGVSVELTGEGAVQVEVWALAPGRFFGSEWKPWIVPSPVRVVPRGAGI
ncbi:CehA/McbA family metallohydrolase [Myxococcaceae bacterium GXIMD 01537]